MPLPIIPSTLRGVSQLRGPIFNPQTGTWNYPGFNGSGLSTTGSPPPTTTPVPATPSPPPPSAQPTGPLGLTGGGGTQSGLRGITAERSRGGGDGGRGLANAGNRQTDRVDLTGALGAGLDIASNFAPGPLGAIATVAKGAMAYGNADVSSKQLQAAGYSQGLSTGQKIGAVTGQVSPFGLAGNNLGAGDWRSVLDASAAAQRSALAGEQQYNDPSGLKTSPSGPVSRKPTYATRAAPLPDQQPPAPAGTPPAGIRSVQAGGSQKSVVDRSGREVRDPDIRAAGQLAGTPATGSRPTPSDRSRSGGEGGSRGGHAADGGNDGSPNGGRGYGGGRGGGAGSSGYGGPR